MKTTALYFSPAGAQRVTVLKNRGATSLVETRDGDRGPVETSLLSDFREEEETENG